MTVVMTLLLALPTVFGVWGLLGWSSPGLALSATWAYTGIGVLVAIAVFWPARIWNVYGYMWKAIVDWYARGLH